MNMTKSKSNKPSRTYDIYLGHVPKSIQESSLVEAFSKYGIVADVLIRHQSGPYGYAIVKFKQKNVAEKIIRQIQTISINNHEMEIRNGKRSNQSVDNCNTGSKMVTFIEPCLAMQPIENIYMPEIPVPMNDIHCSGYSSCENIQVPLTVEIMCTNVEDATTFHGCIITSYEELTHLSVKLNSICPNLQHLTRKPIINRVYGAMYTADGQWYRCRVLRYGPLANSSSCIVEYIDYGNVAEICYTDMVELPEPLKNLTPFAIKCTFTNLVPTAKSVQNCVSYLHHLVNHRMSLFALHTWGSSEYSVTKCSCNGIDVIAELVRNGYAMYKTQEHSRNTSPKINKPPKIQENKIMKKGNENHKNKKQANSVNGTSKYSLDGKNGGITILEKSDRSSSSVESQDFIPKKIIKRGNESVVDCPVFEPKSVNDHLKIDSVIANVKLINNIRSLIPLHSYDDLINEAVELLQSEIIITVSNESKQHVEKARKAYCDALRNIKDCSDLNLLTELKEKRNQKQTELCIELEKYLKSFDCTLLDKRKKIQETITALESNSTAWLNVYLSKTPETIEDLLIAFNEEKEKKRKKIEKARKNTEEKRENFLKVYADLGKEFSLTIANGMPDESCILNSIGKKGSWALKFDEALTDFEIALEEERKISTVIEDRSHISVIQYILEKLDIPKDKIDAECDVYEKYKSFYDDLTNSLDLSPIFYELHMLSKIISSFDSDPSHTSTNKFSDEHAKLHIALLREDALLASVVKASTQHFPELVTEHPELKIEEYQYTPVKKRIKFILYIGRNKKYFCLLKFSWNVSFFPHINKCNRIEPSYVSNLGNDSVVIKEFSIDCDSEKDFIKRVKIWNEIKSTALVKIRGLFKNKSNSSRCDEISCNTSNNLVNGDASHETETSVPGIIHDENQNTVNNESGEKIQTNCQWIDCTAEFMSHEELIMHVYADHVEKLNQDKICRWKECPTKEKPFKSLDLLIVHMRKHIGKKSLIRTTKNVIYAVLPAAWETLYDNPLSVPVDYKMALNVLHQVLEALCNIHSKNITHGAIHPMSILREEEKIMLDFNFDKNLLKDKLCLNGINFQVPKGDLYKSADMYGFGCLVLWVLFPNLSFQSTAEDVPNINAFQSIIENMLLPKDFTALCALLSVNCNLRPTSRMLRSNGFLKEFRILSESSSF